MSFGTGRRRKVVRKLIRRFGDICSYCRVPLEPEPSDGILGPTTRTVDHVVPRSLGGTHNLANLVLSCSRCNGAKGASPVEEFTRTVEVQCSSESN
jgi:5-methylcytosine-specific restriction endonuclease McrA